MRRFLLTKPLTVLLSLLCAATLSPVFVGAAHAADFGFQSGLTPPPFGSGPVVGHVIVSPTAENKGAFAVEIEVNVRDMPPDSMFMVERRVDDPTNDHADGVCESTTWLTNVTKGSTTITTSEGGAGAVHFEVERGKPFNSGVSFDVQFHVIDKSGTEVLISPCMTVTVK